MRIFQHANYPFMQWRRRAYIITGVMLLAGFAAMIMNATNRYGSWLNYGVDFKGGTVVQLEFNQPVQADQLRAAAEAAGRTGWEITNFGSPREFVIRMEAFSGSSEQVVQQTLASRFPPTSYRIVRTEAVGPKVGNELQFRALVAILLSLMVTMVYLWVRFEWRFGLAAIAATMHDILITLGLLALMGSEISLGTVAAFLTIVGYSLNDTIVVFDRIREDLAKPRHGKTYMELLNQAINETLPRTVLTASGTLATLVSLAVLGGPVIRDFAVVLILGIFIGTFSSIFVASPVLYFIESKWPHKPPTRQQAAPSQSGRPRARTAV
ncbi:MAG TPA: protein translocase subunit SecF [Longimicrobium sp.]|jgi:preprotein translocase subunit SecF|uniref:protein translocase subunit SecF n=1 Tax=Longimicrobium sp. TaxID=2029185 RepID=UPI002ED99116